MKIQHKLYMQVKLDRHAVMYTGPFVLVKDFFLVRDDTSFYSTSRVKGDNSRNLYSQKNRGIIVGIYIVKKKPRDNSRKLYRE